MPELLHAPGFDSIGDGDPPERHFHLWSALYNDYGDMTDVAMLDIDGKPAGDLDGFDKWHGEYDSAGNCILRRYQNSSTGMIAEITYNTAEAETNRKYLTRSGAPARLIPTAGQMIDRTFYPNGQPQLETTVGFDPSVVGFARRVRTYDSAGHETSVSFFDAMGQAVNIQTCCRVAAVIPGSRADAQYQFRRGDIITEYDGKAVAGPASYYKIFDLKQASGNLSVELAYRRGNDRRPTLTVYAIEFGLILQSDVDVNPAPTTRPSADAPGGGR
jgi:hypothetical protein